ncbi:MAG: hypothetical protein KDH88_13695 [Chromatiales bacterium]|nr:hypothetical protein [Chromatiales bacterium]
MSDYTFALIDETRGALIVDVTTDTHQKCLSINLDNRKYGTIAEIGAGQETARWFFRAGGAAGTVAKAMSAYDMKFSDAIYGESPRYVSRARLNQMLDIEYSLVIERLDKHRGAESTFFAFANTVASRSYSRKQDGQGWLGVKFQTSPQQPPSRIDLHVYLSANDVLRDQESLGILGVNLIYGAFQHHASPEALLKSLLDGLSSKLVEVDMVDFYGPAFETVDNRLMALRLVEYGLTSGAMFNAKGKVVQPADALYNKAVLVERSRFRPPTLLNINMLDCAQRRFAEETGIPENDLVVISEMTLHNLREGETIDTEDFLDRADILCALGKNVLVSNMGEYYRLASYLLRCTRKPLSIVLGIPTLKQIFNEIYYENLQGGILEAFGRLFKSDLRLYISPSLNPDGSVVTLDEFEPEPHLRHLFHYLRENRLVRALDTVNRDYLTIYADEVLRDIKAGQDGWRAKVPELVAQVIAEKDLFR